MSSHRMNKERLSNTFNARRRGGGKERGVKRPQGALRRPENILKARSDKAKLAARGRGGSRGRGSRGRGGSSRGRR